MSPKRQRTMSNVAESCHKAKLAKAMEKWDQGSESRARKLMLDAIVKELTERPEKLNKAHRAVLSDVFLEQPPDMETPQKRFSEHLRKVSRVPQGYLRTFLSGLSDEKVSEKQLRLLEAADKKVLLKLLQCACGVEPSWPFGPYDQEEWVRFVCSQTRCLWHQDAALGMGAGYGGVVGQLWALPFGARMHQPDS